MSDHSPSHDLDPLLPLLRILNLTPFPDPLDHLPNQHLVPLAKRPEIIPRIHLPDAPDRPPEIQPPEQAHTQRCPQRPRHVIHLAPTLEFLAALHPPHEPREGNPHAAHPSHESAPVDAVSVPVHTGGIKLVQVREFQLAFPQEEVVGEHDAGHGAEEDAVAAKYIEEFTCAVEELPGLHDEGEARHEEHAALDGEDAGEEGAEVHPCGEAVVGDDHAELGGCEGEAGEGDGGAGAGRVGVVGLQG